MLINQKKTKRTITGAILSMQVVVVSIAYHGAFTSRAIANEVLPKSKIIYVELQVDPQHALSYYNYLFEVLKEAGFFTGQTCNTMILIGGHFNSSLSSGKADRKRRVDG